MNENLSYMSITHVKEEGTSSQRPSRGGYPRVSVNKKVSRFLCRRDKVSTGRTPHLTPDYRKTSAKKILTCTG